MSNDLYLGTFGCIIGYIFIMIAIYFLKIDIPTAILFNILGSLMCMLSIWLMIIEVKK